MVRLARLAPRMVVILILAWALLGPPLLDEAARPATAAPGQRQPAVCAGDEQITFAPPNPQVGQTLLIAVSSAQPHVGVWLSGPPS